MATEKDWQFMAHMMYDTIKLIVDNLLVGDVREALILSSAIMNDYEEVAVPSEP